MSEEDTVPEGWQQTLRPTDDGRAGWRVFWQARHQPWRTEAEIDVERQGELARRREITPRVREGMYPFAGMKLARADVEWLLASHDSGRGPVDWGDEEQRRRQGLDLRGADLSRVDLRGLPLARTLGGLAGATAEQVSKAAAHLEGANLHDARLEGADLRGARLEGADLRGASLVEADLRGLALERVDLRGADLSRADLRGVQASGANLDEARLVEARLVGADLAGARLRRAHLARAVLDQAHLEGAVLYQAHLEDASLREAVLEGANLHQAHLEGATVRAANLRGADLREAHLERADLLRVTLRDANLETASLHGALLLGVHLEGANLYGARLEGKPPGADLPVSIPPADLRGAFFDSGSNLRHAILGDDASGYYVSLADVTWGGVNLAVVKWSRRGGAFGRRAQVAVLGDEREARRRVTRSGESKDRERWLAGYEAAVRANRQLAVALRSQGLEEDAARFANRAQVLERAVLRRQGQLGAYLFSFFLDLLAGYGYRPGRSVIAYLLMIFGFAATFYTLGQAEPLHLSPLSSLILSITSFHGRGFFPGNVALDDPLTVLAAAEAIIGLVIEISFIATFTQRFFGSR